MMSWEDYKKKDWTGSLASKLDLYQSISAPAWNSFFTYYSIYSAYLLIILLVVLLFKEMYVWAGVTGFVIHFHIFLIQIWRKIKDRW